MSLRERIVSTILVNLAWSAVFFEAKLQYGAYWIMRLTDMVR